MKLMITFLMLFSISNAFSQTSTEAAAIPTTTPSNSSTDVSFWEKIKKAPIGFTLTNEIVADTKTTSVTGVNNATDAFFSYKLTSKNTLGFATGATLSDTNTTTPISTYNGSTLIFKRSGLLTQDKHGVDMYASLRYKALPGGDTTAGYTELRTGFSRTFSPVLSNVTELRWDEYVRNASDDKLSRRRFAMIVSPTVQINDELSFSPTVVFSESIKGKDTKDTNYLDFNPSIGYNFSQKFYGSLYWDAYPLKSGDNSVFASRWYSTGSVGLYLSYTVL